MYVCIYIYIYIYIDIVTSATANATALGGTAPRARPLQTAVLEKYSFCSVHNFHKLLILSCAHFDSIHLCAVLCNYIRDYMLLIRDYMLLY